MRNQYFQLEYRDTSAFLHIFPPVDGGSRLEITEVLEYLSSKKLDRYDLKEINAKISDLEHESVAFVGDWDGIPCRESMDVRISLDKMKVVCRFYPPSAGGVRLNVNDILSELAFRKVRYGIDEQAIMQFLTEREYCKDYLFATGLQPVHGKDAKIEYFFNTNTNLQPKRNEDGSVDYKELNTISHIMQGDLLARLIKEDPGTSGKNVYGEEIKPRTVRSLKLEYGNFITINEDRTEIYSDVTGHANCINGKVFVSNVFQVPADVDNSVGNIDYEGSVEIKGNVKGGFTVRATGDIIIEGVVENAYVESRGGQIIVKRGIHGMHKGVLRAATNVMAKYIENASVYAGGYVEAEAILNSDISATGEVRVHGKKGLINGGTIRAGRSIEVEYAGTEMGTFTTLEVGIEPEKKERYTELSKEVTRLSKELEDMKVILNNYAAILKKGDVLPKDKMMYVQTLANEYKVKKEEVEPLRDEMRVIHLEMMESDRAYIAVTRTIYPGVVLSISDLTYHIKDKANYCKYKKQNGEIASVPF